MPRVAAVIIGNEVLSGKIVDQNSPWLASRCHDLGLDLVRVVVIPDLIEVIATEVNRALDVAEIVFTSGGVGPTHDDVTMAGVAAAFGVGLVRSPELEAALRERISDRYAQDEQGLSSALRMADIPEGCELLWEGDLFFPIVEKGGVHILPGVPKLFRMKFDGAAHRFKGVPMAHRAFTTTESEPAIANRLAQAQDRWPSVEIGSYPQYDHKPWTVTVTLDSRDDAALAICTDHLASVLSAGLIDPS
jgi:molybdenum cofactor synthesis domain-containing protein